MNKETLFKYLSFLQNECSRHNHDDNISDDEINQLKIEIIKFNKLVKESNLSSTIKKEINTIDFNLDENRHHKNKFFWLKILGGGHGNEKAIQFNRLNRLKKLSDDIENILFSLKATN